MGSIKENGCCTHLPQAVCFVLLAVFFVRVTVNSLFSLVIMTGNMLPDACNFN